MKLFIVIAKTTAAYAKARMVPPVVSIHIYRMSITMSLAPIADWADAGSSLPSVRHPLKILIDLSEIVRKI
jgi:hypothetical protein